MDEERGSQSSDEPIGPQADSPGRLFRLQRLASEARSPAVAAGVTLLLSPFSIVVGFNLNDYLARPILSVEYVDVLIPEARSPLPRDELHQLMSSPGFQLVALRPAIQIATSSLFGAIASKEDSLSAEDASRLQDSLIEFERALRQRDSFLERIGQSMARAGSNDDIRRLTLELDSGAIGKFRSPDLGGEDLKATVLDEIEVEKRTNADLRKQTEPLRTKLATRLEWDGRGTAFKVSLLNRGSADGLVQSRAAFRRHGSSIGIPLMRTEAPEAGSQVGVQVNVVNRGCKRSEKHVRLRREIGAGLAGAWGQGSRAGAPRSRPAWSPWAAP